MLHQLVKRDWWVSPFWTATDDDGAVSVSRFVGDYRITVGDRSVVVSIPTAGASEVVPTVE